MLLFKKYLGSRTDSHCSSDIVNKKDSDSHTNEPRAEEPLQPGATSIIVDDTTPLKSDKKGTPYSSCRMSKRNQSWTVSSKPCLVPIKRRKTLEEGTEENAMTWRGSCKEEVVTVVIPTFSSETPIPKPMVDPTPLQKLVEFLKMCEKHQDFLMRSSIVDKFLLSMVLIYFERARLTAIGYSKDRYFFFALFLAMEMEEDAVDGLSEVIYYVVGNIPPRSTTPGVLSPAEKKWNERLIKFYKGKDRFWGRLGFRTFVSREDCIYVARHLPENPVLRKTRTAEDLLALKKF